MASGNASAAAVLFDGLADGRWLRPVDRAAAGFTGRSVGGGGEAAAAAARRRRRRRRVVVFRRWAGRRARRRRRRSYSTGFAAVVVVVVRRPTVAVLHTAGRCQCSAVSRSSRATKRALVSSTIILLSLRRRVTPLSILLSRMGRSVPVATFG